MKLHNFQKEQEALTDHAELNCHWLNDQHQSTNLTLSHCDCGPLSLEFDDQRFDS